MKFRRYYLLFEIFLLGAIVGFGVVSVDAEMRSTESQIVLENISARIAMLEGIAPFVPVTEDDVNRISKRLFCPVCENIPLDACGTAACNDWRNEIRFYMERGMTEDEIRADFVARFGDRVVGVPQDRFLRVLTLVTPWLLVAVGFLVVVRSFVVWRGHQVRAMSNPAPAPMPMAQTDDNPFLAQLEQDLKG